MFTTVLFLFAQSLHYIYDDYRKLLSSLVDCAGHVFPSLQRLVDSNDRRLP